MATNPGPWKLLFASRKFNVAWVTVLATLAVSFVGSKYGLNLNLETVITTSMAVLASGLSLIFGITMEDAAAKKTASSLTVGNMQAPTAVEVLTRDGSQR